VLARKRWTLFLPRRRRPPTTPASCSPATAIHSPSPKQVRGDYTRRAWSLLQHRRHQQRRDEHCRTHPPAPTPLQSPHAQATPTSHKSAPIFKPFATTSWPSATPMSLLPSKTTAAKAPSFLKACSSGAHRPTPTLCPNSLGKAAVSASGSARASLTACRPHPHIWHHLVRCGQQRDGVRREDRRRATGWLAAAIAVMHHLPPPVMMLTLWQMKGIAPQKKVFVPEVFSSTNGYASNAKFNE
jgi:hypothetical protein